MTLCTRRFFLRLHRLASRFSRALATAIARWFPSRCLRSPYPGHDNASFGLFALIFRATFLSTRLQRPVVPLFRPNVKREQPAKVAFMPWMTLEMGPALLPEPPPRTPFRGTHWPRRRSPSMRARLLRVLPTWEIAKPNPPLQPPSLRIQVDPLLFTPC
jgi:hypothetical protein